MLVSKKVLFKFRMLTLVMVGLLISCSIYSGAVRAMERTNNSTEVILVGASVGKGWRFPELPQRIGVKDGKFEYIGVFDTFDKSSAIKNILARAIKPKVVIIKECSVYFPGDFNLYKNKIKEWVNALEKNNIEPVLATTVPPGKPNGIVYKLKSIIKKISGRSLKINAIIDYNEWIRDFAGEKGIKLLDLEKALRISDNNRYLNPKYDRGDFTHINKDAYLILDIIMGDLLKQI